MTERPGCSDRAAAMTALEGPWRRDGQLYTESIVITAGPVRRIVQAHPEEGLST
jgi:hypothetical protein